MKATTAKAYILKLIGLIFCTVPVIAAVLLYFPLWRERGGEAVLSGFTLLLLLAALVPLFNAVKSLLKSPSAHTMWFISFAAFFILSSIAEEMTVISFVGFVGNLVGAVFFKIARKGERRNEEQL